MIFRQLFERESCIYTYLIGDERTREAVLIDPVLSERDGYLRLLNELGLTLVRVLETHIHADHITAAGALRTATGCQTLLGEPTLSTCVSATFREGDRIPVGGLELVALYTPGHTDDSYCFRLETPGRRLLFSGDTLLIRGTGRTDFQNGDAVAQYRSLQRLLALPGDTEVWPGHDYKGWTSSTIAEVKAHNPRLQVADEAAYVRQMAALKLPDPKWMDVAVPANRACGAT